jgi:hypothetical protein
MTVEEIKTSNEEGLIEYIRRFVADPRFLKIKDAFVAHAPTGESQATQTKTESPLVLAHGKQLGTTYVFNEFEAISRIVITKQPKPSGRASGSQDPDLES